MIGLGILYTFISWMFVAGWGPANVVAPSRSYGRQNARHGYFSAFYPLTDTFVGHWLTLAFQLLIVTGSFACQMAFFNTSARYFFSMGRERILPRPSADVHPTHRSPYIAALPDDHPRARHRRRLHPLRQLHDRFDLQARHVGAADGRLRDPPGP